MSQTKPTLSRDEAEQRLNAIASGTKIEVTGLQGDVEFTDIGYLWKETEEQAHKTLFWLRRPGDTGKYIPFFSDDIRYISITPMREQSLPPKRAVARIQEMDRKKPAQPRRADEEPMSHKPQEERLNQQLLEGSEPQDAQSAARTQILDTQVVDTMHHYGATPQRFPVDGSQPHLQPQIQTQVPQPGYLQLRQPHLPAAIHHQQVGQPAHSAHLAYASQPTYQQGLFQRHVHTPMPAPQQLFHAGGGYDGGLYQSHHPFSFLDSDLAAETMGQAIRGENTPMWTLVPGLKMATFTGMPCKVFSLVHYVHPSTGCQSADDAARNWRADMTSVNDFLTRPTQVNRTQDPRVQSSYNTQLLYAKMEVEQVLKSTTRLPADKDGFLTLILPGVHLMALCANMRLGYNNGAGAIWTRFDMAWRRGILNFDDIFGSNATSNSSEKFREK